MSEVEVRIAAQGSLHATYYVRNAGWFPLLRHPLGRIVGP